MHHSMSYAGKVWQVLLRSQRLMIADVEDLDGDFFIYFFGLVLKCVLAGQDLHGQAIKFN
jgi:hypothetical protein